MYRHFHTVAGFRGEAKFNYPETGPGESRSIAAGVPFEESEAGADRRLPAQPAAVPDDPVADFLRAGGGRPNATATAKRFFRRGFFFYGCVALAAVGPLYPDWKQEVAAIDQLTCCKGPASAVFPEASVDFTV